MQTKPFVWRTIIYCNSFMIGSHWNTTIHLKHVKWYENDTLQKVERRYRINDGSTCFLFEGKCMDAQNVK